MLKKISLLLIFMLCISLCVLAQETDLQNSNIPNVSSSQIQAVKQRVSNLLEQSLNSKPNLKKPTEFASIMNAKATAVYDNVCAYISFVYENEFTNAEFAVINRILSKGTTIQSLMEVYDFWLTTDEDFSMIEEICALENRYFSEYWYENVFNKLTDFKHGELGVKEIIEYKEKGITTDEILAANVMCRKDGQNIVDILDKVLNGTSIENQAKALYGVNEVVVDGTLFSAVDKLAKQTKAKSKTNLFKQYNINLDGELLKEAIQSKVETSLKELGISDVRQDTYEDYQAMQHSGYPLNVQRALLNKGYTPQEIKKAAELKIMDFYTAAKSAREMLKNEK